MSRTILPYRKLNATSIYVYVISLSNRTVKPLDFLPAKKAYSFHSLFRQVTNELHSVHFLYNCPAVNHLDVKQSCKLIMNSDMQANQVLILFGKTTAVKLVCGLKKFNQQEYSYSSSFSPEPYCRRSFESKIQRMRLKVQSTI